MKKYRLVYRLTKKGRRFISIITIIFVFFIGNIVTNTVINAADINISNINDKKYLMIENEINPLLITNLKQIIKNEVLLNKEDGMLIHREEISQQPIQNFSQTIYLPIDKIYEPNEKKLAFLTFDDGPSRYITPQILNILDNYQIKATFFVIGNLISNNQEIIKEIEQKGHAIGLHTYTHVYDNVYSNEYNFINELNNSGKALKNVLGENFETFLFRFPGGSFGLSRQPFKEILKKEGYSYLDWNSLVGDAEGNNCSVSYLFNRFVTTSKNKENIVVLLHDCIGKQSTVDVLPQVLDYIKNEGYEFALPIWNNNLLNNIK